jgi:hypothetical protein
MTKKINNPCFIVNMGKAHRLVVDEDTKRFPLGRAKCAPFPRLPQDIVVEPNDVASNEFCRMCL